MSFEMEFKGLYRKRFNIRIPPEFERDFYEDCRREIRQPHDMITKIMAVYYRMKSTNTELRLILESGDLSAFRSDKRRRIPVFGPLRKQADQSK